jgi:hypothetical protein
MLLILATCFLEEISSDLKVASTLIPEALEEAPTRRDPRTLRLLFLNGRTSGLCFLLRNPIQREKEQADGVQGT